MLILASIITGCVSMSAFTSLVYAPVGITSCATGRKDCTITARIKKYESITKKKKKKHDKTVLLGNNKLNTIEVLKFKALIHSYISHDEFVSVNNLIRNIELFQ